MNITDLATTVLICVGMFFFLAGTVGLLRFPDLFSRLHALTKADNVGLGLICAALMLQADDWQTVFKLGLIWVMVGVASANVCVVIASESLRRKAQADAEGRP